MCDPLCSSRQGEGGCLLGGRSGIKTSRRTCPAPGAGRGWGAGCRPSVPRALLSAPKVLASDSALTWESSEPTRPQPRTCSGALVCTPPSKSAPTEPQAHCRQRERCAALTWSQLDVHQALRPFPHLTLAKAHEYPHCTQVRRQVPEFLWVRPWCDSEGPGLPPAPTPFSWEDAPASRSQLPPRDTAGLGTGLTRRVPVIGAPRISPRNIAGIFPDNNTMMMDIGCFLFRHRLCHVTLSDS